MRAARYAYLRVYATRAESSSDVIADMVNEHFMQKQNNLFREFRSFRSLVDVFHHPREIFSFKEFVLGDISIKINLKKNLSVSSRVSVLFSMALELYNLLRNFRLPRIIFSNDSFLR